MSSSLDLGRQEDISSPASALLGHNAPQRDSAQEAVQPATVQASPAEPPPAALHSGPGTVVLAHLLKVASSFSGSLQVSVHLCLLPLICQARSWRQEA